MYLSGKSRPSFRAGGFFRFYPPAGGQLDFLPQAVTINAQKA